MSAMAGGSANSKTLPSSSTSIVDLNNLLRNTASISHAKTQVESCLREGRSDLVCLPALKSGFYAHEGIALKDVLFTSYVFASMIDGKLESMDFPIICIHRFPLRLSWPDDGIRLWSESSQLG